MTAVAGSGRAEEARTGAVLLLSGGLDSTALCRIAVRKAPSWPTWCPAAHPLPPRPDRGAHPGEEPHREAAGISRDQAVVRGHRPARGHQPGHHGPPDRRGTQPQGPGPAGPRTRPPQDHRAGARPGRRGVLHPGARRAALDRPTRIPYGSGPRPLGRAIDHQIRRSRHIVQDRLLPSVRDLPAMTQLMEGLPTPG
jgi:hypothetical protein